LKKHLVAAAAVGFDIGKLLSFRVASFSRKDVIIKEILHAWNLLKRESGKHSSSKS